MPIWLINFVSHIGFKTTSVILAITLVGLGAFSWIKIHDAKVKAKALIECPPQTVITGNNNVIDQRIRKMGCFPLRIGHFGIGLCHD